MSIGSDKSESSKQISDPVIDAQRNLVANPAIDPQDLLLEQNDPVQQQPAATTSDPPTADDSRTGFKSTEN
jgi:hypothetical protein